MNFADLSPALALRAAIRASLAGDAALAAALGGPKIYDEAPARAARPYVTFGDVQARDDSVQEVDGDEQTLVLCVWSGERGLREALEIAGRVADTVCKARLDLVGHRLVSIAYAGLSARRENSGRFARADIRFRAVSERL